MKVTLKSTIQHPVSGARPDRTALDVQRSPVQVLRAAERGVALVITLILLAVITFMAVTFLVLSQRQRNAVTTTTDLTTARFAADTALARAESASMANMLAFNNDQAIRLIVSTNYINPLGFNLSPPANGNRFTDVSYTYPNGSLLNAADLQQNIANLLYDPRPPVFVSNRLAGRIEAPFYLDLNRNGVYDPNGMAGITDNLGQPLVDRTTGLPATNFFVGDPEWIGIPEHPDWPISSSNQFVARIAYFVVPTSDALDINYIHNQAKNQAITYGWAGSLHP